MEKISDESYNHTINIIDRKSITLSGIKKLNNFDNKIKQLNSYSNVMCNLIRCIIFVYRIEEYDGIFFAGNNHQILLEFDIMPKIYDFELMEGGGHITGTKIESEELYQKIADSLYEIFEENSIYASIRSCRRARVWHNQRRFSR